MICDWKNDPSLGCARAYDGDGLPLDEPAPTRPRYLFVWYINTQTGKVRYYEETEVEGLPRPAYDDQGLVSKTVRVKAPVRVEFLDGAG